MRSTRGIERSSGVVMLLSILLVLGSLFGPGISGSEPYFSEDFPQLVAERGDHLRATLFRFAFAGAILASAWLLYLTFRALVPGAARLGAGALGLSGIAFGGSAAAGVRIYTLAAAWADGGAAGDATWQAARTAATLQEGTTFLGLLLLAASFGTFGIAIARERLLPRPIGWVAAAAAATVAAAFIAFAFGDDVGWWMLMAGTLTVLVALALTGLWLVARGLAQPGAQPPAA